MTTDQQPTRGECLAEAAQLIVDGRARQAARTPRQAAVAAWYPGHPLSVDELEDEIRGRRGLPPLNRRTGAA